MSSNFSIYLADKECGGGDHPIVWYHTSLILVDEDAGKVVQELEFNNTKKSLRMQPKVNNDQRGIEYMRNQFTLKKMLGGDEAVMLSAWNHMLKYAVFIHQNEVVYDQDFINLADENTINCRAGIVAALASIGIVTKSGDSEEDLGINARDRLPLGVLFLLSSTPHQSLEELRDAQDELSGLLTNENWPRAETYDLGQGWAS